MRTMFQERTVLRGSRVRGIPSSQPGQCRVSRSLFRGGQALAEFVHLVERADSRLTVIGVPSPGFLVCADSKGVKTPHFGSADSKEVADAFSASADSKGDRRRYAAETGKPEWEY